MSTTIDYITVPLVNSKKDIDSVRDNLGGNAKIIQILAKIDSVDGVQNFDEIIKSANGIVIDRQEISYDI